MRVFQSTYRDRKTGKTRKTKTWYVEFRDHNRDVRRLPGLTDRRQTEAIGRKLEQLVAMKLAGEAPDATMTRWLETVPDKLRKKLAGISLIDPRRAAASKPLSEHLDDFEAALKSKGNTEKHAKLTKARAKRLIDGCGFTYWSEITPSRVERFLAELRAGTPDRTGIGAASSNHHLGALKSFGRWMVRDRRASESHVEHLKPLNARTDRRHERRALCADEVGRLTRTASDGPEREGVSGPERALLYRLAVETGLRATELRSLTKASFDLSGLEPTVTVKAAYSKRRREDVVPLRSELAAALRGHLGTKLPDAPAFKMPRPNRLVFMLRADLEAAREAWIKEAETAEERDERERSSFLTSRDEAGRVVDFHALRHTTGSLLAAAGVHPKTAQSIMRHSTIGLTMDRYTHTLRGADRTAVEALPSFGSDEPARHRATGTEGRVPAAEDAARLAYCLARQGTDQPNSVHQPAVEGDHAMRPVPALEPLENSGVDAKSGGYNDDLSDPAEYPSGLRGRIANPLFAGSNPASACGRAVPGTGVSRPQAAKTAKKGLPPPQSRRMFRHEAPGGDRARPAFENAQNKAAGRRTSMKTRVFLTVAGAAGTAILIAQLRAGADPPEGAAPVGGPVPVGGCTPSTGPDVIVGDLIDMDLWGTVGGISGYSIGTESCNIGNEPLLWDQDTNNHPVIGQNLYRLKDGRFEQIGQSWLKHGFAALTLNLCCTCENPGTSQLLGVGCSDPYGAFLNGDQEGFPCGGGNTCGGLGPRSEVNAATGEYAYPYGSAGMGGNAIYKRLQVHVVDVDPSLNEGALYFGEGHYVSPDDAAENNHDNNASWEQILVGSPVGGGWNLSLTGSTTREKAAIYAWQDEDPQVVIQIIDDASQGQFHLGYRVTDNGDGTWHYEYALHNLNSHQSAREFIVPVGADVTITNVGFHDVDYHSGEPYNGIDWSSTTGGGTISWSTPTFAENEDANALRWGTLYNFRFDADTPPTDVTAEIGLFRPGAVTELMVVTLGPSEANEPCPWDCADGDGEVGIVDFLELLAQWGMVGTSCDFDFGGGGVDIGDFLKLLSEWGVCP